MNRLEEIKDRMYNGDSVWDLSEQDYMWLFSQVELYQECQADALKLHEENKRYEEALSFYAYRQAYYFTGQYPSEVMKDYGHKARQALKGESE